MENVRKPRHSNTVVDRLNDKTNSISKQPKFIEEFIILLPTKMICSKSEYTLLSRRVGY